MVIEFLIWKYTGLLESFAESSNVDYLNEILNCLNAANDFMSTLYRSGLFLSRLRLTRVVRVGKAMLSSYSLCARAAFHRSLARFKFNPKFHMLCHIVLQLKQDLDAHRRPINPISYSCQMPEDFINRVSTLSRAVHSKVVELRTLDLYKLGVGQALQEG